MVKGAVVVCVGVLSGCAGTELAVQTQAGQVQLTQAWMALAALPVIDREYHPDGTLKRETIRAPFVQPAPALRLPEDPVAAAVRDGLKTVGTLGGLYFGGKAAADLAGVVGGNLVDLGLGLGRPSGPVYSGSWDYSQWTGTGVAGGDLLSGEGAGHGDRPVSMEVQTWANSGRIDSPDDYSRRTNTTTEVAP